MMKFGKAIICLILTLVLINILPYLGLQESTVETLGGIIWLCAIVLIIIFVYLDYRKKNHAGATPPTDKKKSESAWTADETKLAVKFVAVFILILVGIKFLVGISQENLRKHVPRVPLTTGLIGQGELEKTIVFRETLRVGVNYHAFYITRKQPLTLNKFRFPIDIRINQDGNEEYTRYLPDQAGLTFPSPESGRLEIRSTADNNAVIITREHFSMWQSL